MGHQFLEHVKLQIRRRVSEGLLLTHAAQRFLFCAKYSRLRTHTFIRFSTVSFDARKTCIPIKILSLKSKQVSGSAGRVPKQQPSAHHPPPPPQKKKRSLLCHRPLKPQSSEKNSKLTYPLKRYIFLHVS
jgi:hypothetical protein